jgi:hypothetical protein
MFKMSSHDPFGHRKNKLWRKEGPIIKLAICVVTSLLEEWEDDTHTPTMGTWKSFGTPKALEFNCRGQNTLPWSVPYIIGKLSKCKCWKWPHMNHLDIYNTSYCKKKGQESNWQFDSRPLKIGNWPDPGVCKWSATHCWKVLEESYKFSWDFIPIRGLSKELWTHKFRKFKPGQFRDSSLGVPRQEAIRM